MDVRKKRTWKNDRLVGFIIWTSVTLALLALLLVFSVGRGYLLPDLPWFLPTIQAFAIVAAITISALCFGRFSTLGGPWTFWAGLAFLANAIFGIFYILTWPELLGDAGAIGRISNTSSWFRLLAAWAVALVTLFGVTSNPRRLSTSRLVFVYLLAALLVTIVGLLSVAAEGDLPSTLAAGAFTPLGISLIASAAALMALGAFATAKRYLAEGDRFLAYLSLFFLIMAFSLLAEMIGGQRYNLWWYGSRLLYFPAYLFALFGLLQEGYALYRVERERGQENAQLFEQIRSVNERMAITSIRARELAEESQRRADELNALFESMAEGVLVVDAEGNMVRLNRAGLELWGIASAEDALGKPVHSLPAELRYPDDRPVPAEESPITRARRGEVFTQQEIVFVKPDRSRRNLLVAGSAVRDEAGRVVLGMVVFRDITPIRDLERQREEFISVVAHDLRGAMTTIKGFASLLTRPATRDTLPEPVQKAVDAIANSSRRMERMISDLLDVSRIEARRLTLTKRPVDLVALVNEIAARSAEATRGHQIKVQELGPVPQLEVDPDRFEQILGNLLSNAGKYSYPDTEITVEVEPRPVEVVVSVTNLGPGILPEDREKLFTRFHRTRQAQQENIPGLGLGLYIAKGLVEAHGGRIWVESKPGENAVFRFTLPV